MTNYLIHKEAIVETDHIGRGSRVWAFVHILKGAVIGENANICDHCFIENNVIIGNNVTIKSGVYLWDGINIEDNVFIGPAAVFTNDRFPRSKNHDYTQEKIHLMRGSSIGGNATILPGITVGAHAMVGAGAVVTKDIPDFGIVYGNPGRLQGYMCVCTNKMEFKNETFECACGRRYKRDNQKVTEST